MVLRTPKPTREERANMTRDELLRSVWLLDDVIESFRWIPVSEQLPEDPSEEEMEDNYINCPEYIVTIKGATESTALYYIGDGYWWDYETDTTYDVVAWMSMPESYRS